MKIISESTDASRPPATLTPAGTPANGPGRAQGPAAVPYATQGDRPPDRPPDGGPGHRGGVFVWIMIACAVLLVLGAMASIYHRWYNLRLPTSYILLTGDETTANAVVTVLMERKEVARVTLKESEKYQVPVLVEPGVYTIEARVNGTLAVVHRFILPDGARGVMIPITLREDANKDGSLGPGSRAYLPGTRPAGIPGG